MSINQALSAAVAGVNVTQQALSVISGNVANANTPGYVDESVNQVEVGIAGQTGAGVDVTGVNRDLNTLLQSQLWTETSGGSYADTTAQLYQQLQQVYGTPGSSTSFDAIFNNFTSALQSLSTSPSSYSAQSAAVSAAQGVAQNLNSMSAGIQQLRSQAEAGIANGVQTANTALQQIAQINQQLIAASPDSSTATLEDQRDQDITQLSQLMNVNVVQGSNNQISVFTGTGQQLVASNQAAQLVIQRRRNIDGDVAMERQSQPRRRWHHNPDFARRRDDRSGRDKLHSVGPDRRLPADARQHPAAGADPARRVGKSDVAGVLEPDDVRHGGDVRLAGRL